MNEEGSVPTVDKLPLCIENRVYVRKKALFVGVFTTEGVSKISIAPDGAVGVSFDQSDVTQAEPTDALQVIAQRRLFAGVVMEEFLSNEFAGWFLVGLRCGRWWFG